MSPLHEATCRETPFRRSGAWQSPCWFARVRTPEGWPLGPEPQLPSRSFPTTSSWSPGPPSPEERNREPPRGQGWVPPRQRGAERDPGSRGPRPAETAR